VNSLYSWPAGGKPGGGPGGPPIAGGGPPIVGGGARPGIGGGAAMLAENVGGGEKSPTSVAMGGGGGALRVGMLYRSGAGPLLGGVMGTYAASSLY